MKKLLLLAALLLPAVPSLMAGIDSQVTFSEDQRDKLLGERFKAWCLQEGYDYYGMSENDSETLWLDFWCETDDYQAAVDSVDSVLNIVSQALADK